MNQSSTNKKEEQEEHVIDLYARRVERIANDEDNCLASEHYRMNSDGETFFRLSVGTEAGEEMMINHIVTIGVTLSTDGLFFSIRTEEYKEDAVSSNTELFFDEGTVSDVTIKTWDNPMEETIDYTLGMPYSSLTINELTATIKSRTGLFPIHVHITEHSV